jgi:hypothetical protein
VPVLINLYNTIGYAYFSLLRVFLKTNKWENKPINGFLFWEISPISLFRILLLLQAQEQPGFTRVKPEDIPTRWV